MSLQRGGHVSKPVLEVVYFVLVDATFFWLELTDHLSRGAHDAVNGWSMVLNVFLKKLEKKREMVKINWKQNFLLGTFKTSAFGTYSFQDILIAKPKLMEIMCVPTCSQNL